MEAPDSRTHNRFRVIDAASLSTADQQRSAHVPRPTSIENWFFFRPSRAGCNLS